MNKRRKGPDLDDFKAWRKNLRKRYKRADEAGKSARPRDDANNVMRLRAYAYFCELKRSGQIGKLRDYVRGRDGSEWNGHGDEDEQWVFRLLAARGKQLAGQDEKSAAKARALRSRMCAEFKLASINKVRPEALLGFLYEAGPAAQIKRDAKNSVSYSWAPAYQ